MDATTPHNRIVVGTDGSEPAGHAVEWAAAEASLREAVLEVVHAWTPPYLVSPIGVPGPPWDVAPYKAAAKDLVERVVETHCANTPLGETQLRTRTVRGSAVTALLECAASADLLVVGSRGHGEFAGMVLGSVSQQCVHHSRCPVTIVKAASAPATSRIVVGVDGSEGSYRALRWATQEAITRRATLSVVHAWEDWVMVAPFGPVVPPGDPGSFERSSSAMVNEMIERAAFEVGTRPTHVETLVLETTPRRALHDLSGEADLLVVGSRGRGGFTGLLLGSVSQYCVHHAECPTTVVPRVD